MDQWTLWTPPSHCYGLGSISGWETKIPQAMKPKKNKMSLGNLVIRKIRDCLFEEWPYVWVYKRF